MFKTVFYVSTGVDYKLSLSTVEVEFVSVLLQSIYWPTYSYFSLTSLPCLVNCQIHCVKPSSSHMKLLTVIASSGLLNA